MQSLFVDDSGKPIPAVSAEQMREVDRVAVDETGPNLYQMMENAGRSLAVTAMEMADDGRIVVLAGRGGNGGGGIAAARHLMNRGLDVSVLVAGGSTAGEVAAFQLRVFEAAGGRRIGPDQLHSVVPDLIIDALIGYSLRGAPSGTVKDLIEWTNGRECPVVSVDMPSGVDATTGETPGVHVVADMTLTLALPKTGLISPAAGDLRLADLGIPVETYRRAGVDIDHGALADDFVIPLTRC